MQNTICAGRRQGSGEIRAGREGRKKPGNACGFPKASALAHPVAQESRFSGADARTDFDFARCGYDESAQGSGRQGLTVHRQAG